MNEKYKLQHHDLFSCEPEMSDEDLFQEFLRRQPDPVPAVGIDEFLKSAHKNPVNADPESFALIDSLASVPSRAYARVLQCDLPPEGWECRLARGHGGPCPTYPRSLASDQATEARRSWWQRLFGDRS